MMNATSWQMMVFLSYIKPTCSASPHECPEDKRAFLVSKCNREIKKCNRLHKQLSRKLAELKMYQKLESRGYTMNMDRRGRGFPAKLLPEQNYEVKKLVLKVDVSRERIDKLEEQIRRSNCIGIIHNNK
ncbi:hypothetical protein C0J52_14212 [Blattella germanica]|nr:hypothetical protein C0J52_14212 [Blattella germanica]